MSMFNYPVTEQDLPGIGRRYQLTRRQRARRHRHRASLRPARRLLAESRPRRLRRVSFTDDQARRLGAILAGVYFKPAAVAAGRGSDRRAADRLGDPSRGSLESGRSIADLGIRRQTRMTIAAIVRDELRRSSRPSRRRVLESGDQLVVIGRPDDLPTFLARVVG